MGVINFGKGFSNSRILSTVYLLLVNLFLSPCCSVPTASAEPGDVFVETDQVMQSPGLKNGQVLKSGLIFRSGMSGLSPIPSTNTHVFKGTDIWVRVGINKLLSGVATSLDLVDAGDNLEQLALIDSRSAAGAAWQSCLTTVDSPHGNLVHYNQSAGNFDKNWGFEGTWTIGDIIGFSQNEWYPLLSNDFRHPATVSAPDYSTSPCSPHYRQNVLPAYHFGSARCNIKPHYLSIGRFKVLRLTNSWTIRSLGNQSYASIDFDQALYLLPNAVHKGNCRVYLAQNDKLDIVGPIQLFGNRPDAIKPMVRRLFGSIEDWSLSSREAKYIVIVFDFAGKEIGIAVHSSDNKPFYGFLRSRAHMFAGELARIGDSSHQFHFTLKSDWNKSLPVNFKNNEEVTYSVDYDIAPVEQLAAEGFKISH